jgi:predicted nucleotidyltransferase
MSQHGLSGEQVQIIQGILRLYREKIDKVGLFGSRATGTFRDNSDIDLVLYGASLCEADIDRLHTLFEETLLPFNVDVTAYHLIDYPPLKKHIDEVMVELLDESIYTNIDLC